MPNKEILINAPMSIKNKTIGLLMCTVQELNSNINRALKEFGISFLQLNILHILSSVPEGILTVNQIKSVMIDDSPNVSRSLNKLMEKDLIEKERSTEDQRVVYIKITPQGIDMHKRADEAVNPVLDIDLEDEDIEKLYNILLKI